MSSPVAVLTFNEVPAVNLSYKYEVLGPLALENHRRWADRHGYHFIAEAPPADGRPFCWAKIPAMLAAFETQEWVLWADSDTLVRPFAAGIDELLDPAFDMVVQSHAAFFRFVGIPLEDGMARMPISTGVFLMHRSDWTLDFLHRTYAETGFVTSGDIWDGIGEQEAMTALLQRRPTDLRRVRHVEGLQNHPRFLGADDRFVHLYGNHGRHLIPEQECIGTLRRWGHALLTDAPWPADLARFHWCAIQNKRADAPHVRGDLEDFLYEPADIGLA